ncbi:MAG: type II toxin-antitoxin system RelE/ParE family toxin [Pseudomonadota bacterium]
MSLPVVMRPEARSEFDDAVDWYELHRPGLGADFVAHVQEVFDQISTTPRLYSPIFQNVRRAVVRRFPHLILYKIEPQQVVVLAVFHSKRDPKIRRQRAVE